MKREYWYILMAYTAMHLSSFIVAPILFLLGNFLGEDAVEFQINASVGWIVFSFTATLFIVLFLLRKEIRTEFSPHGGASFGASLLWAVGGIFLALTAQVIAANIEAWMGVEMGSENTEQILTVIETVPIFIIVSSIIGPILEEIVFRKIIFGVLYKRLKFFLSALLSSVIFALAHGEPEHLLLYSAIGFTFAFLYVKTKRIIVPIIAHVSMNTMVVLIQSVFREDIERYIREYEQIQSFIGGLF